MLRVGNTTENPLEREMDSMPDETATYSVNVTCDDLVSLKQVLYRSCIRQNQLFDSSLRERLGLGRPTSQKLLLVTSLAAAILFSVWLAMTKPDELFGRLVTGGLATIFWLLFAAIVFLRQHGIRAMIVRYFTEPLVRSTVNRHMASSLKLAPFSIVYSFHTAHYTASASELKSERTIDGNSISLAYYSESKYCLFQKETSQGWKAAVFAPELEQRDLVEAFLKRNQVEIHELDADDSTSDSQLVEAESSAENRS
jgi:hypothetical protein